MKLGRIAGIVFRVNLLFLLLCAIYTVLGLGKEIATIITAVLIHELAHTITGVMLGIKITEIELLPFGGQARIEDFTGLEPGKEICLALAGPLTSLSIAAAIHLLTVYLGPMGAGLILFARINLLLGGFNLLPALPLDGGKILRAGLAIFIGYKKATQIAARLGKLMAIIIGGYGLYSIIYSRIGIHYIFIGILLFWAAGREANLLGYLFMRFLVNKKSQLSRNGFLPCRQVVSQENTRVKNILNSASPKYYLLVVVMDDQHRATGIVSEAELIECLLGKGPRGTLKDC